ncbi:MAG: hypothetical protein U0931_05270 [Vulcanimicrobiota bacterium]
MAKVMRLYCCGGIFLLLVPIYYFILFLLAYFIWSWSGQIACYAGSFLGPNHPWRGWAQRGHWLALPGLYLVLQIPEVAQSLEETSTMFGAFSTWILASMAISGLISMLPLGLAVYLHPFYEP